MYADKVTDSMQHAIDETDRRRAKQVAYNTERGIDPQPLRKKIADILDRVYREAEDAEVGRSAARAATARGAAAAASRRGRRPWQLRHRRHRDTRACRAPNWRTSSSSSPTK